MIKSFAIVDRPDVRRYVPTSAAKTSLSLLNLNLHFNLLPQLSSPLLMTHYKTITQPAQAEFKDRGSRFIAYAFPVNTTDDFKKRLNELKDEHPKAAHHCFAYRLGTDGNAFRASDDGEPSGTAGKPVLGQLDSKGLTNAAVVVVRYFGGTLLGVPGLINAYKTAASLALQLAPVMERPVLVQYALEFDYTLMNDVMIFVKRYGGSVLQNEAQLFCRLVVGIPKAEEGQFTDRICDLQGVMVKRC